MDSEYCVYVEWKGVNLFSANLTLQNITSYLGNYSGSVFNYQYSSRVNDGGWFGLHKVSNYAQYIGVSSEREVVYCIKILILQIIYLSGA